MVSAGSLSGRETKRVTPSYPPTAKTHNVVGTVRVFAIVDENGKIWITNSEGPTLLRAAAEEAARNWTFPPSTFNGRPSEIEDAVPFAEDNARRDYSRDSAERLREAFAAITPVFERYRAGFTGKSSPVHFWWGSFDLAVTRFSGRPAPEHPGGVPGLPDRITREAYSQEVSSAGFWAGGVVPAEPFFYSYAYPEPEGYRGAKAANGNYDGTFGEFVLPYAKVRASDDPEQQLLDFLQSTYDAAADLAEWDRAALEREPVAP